MAGGIFQKRRIRAKGKDYSTPARIPGGPLALCLLGVTLLWLLSRSPSFVAAVDLPVSSFVRDAGGHPLDDLSLVLSSRVFLALALLLVTVLARFFDPQGWRLLVLAIVLALVFSAVASELLLKDGLAALGLGRTRPYLAEGLAEPGVRLYSDSSFPSSHVGGLVAALTALVLWRRRLLVPGLIAAVLMALARVHAGMHYPTDALAGGLLGVVCGAVAWSLSRRILGEECRNSQ